jgi:hypothetical protein
VHLVSQQLPGWNLTLAIAQDGMRADRKAVGLEADLTGAMDELLISFLDNDGSFIRLVRRPGR